MEPSAIRRFPETLAAQLALAGLGLAVIYAACGIVLSSGAMAQHGNWVAAAALFDLIVTSGFVLWFALVRTGRVSAAALLPALAINALIGRLILPEGASTTAANALLALGVAVELGLGVFALTRLAKVRSGFMLLKSQGVSFEGALSGALAPHLPGALLPRFVALEVSLVRYAILGGFVRAEPRPAGEPFTIHRECGWSAIAGGFVVLIVLEAVGGHLLIAQWSPLVAGLHTAGSLYGALWVLGDAQAVRLRPMVVSQDHLHLRVGLRWGALIPRHAILSARRVYEAPKGEGVVSVALPGGDLVCVELARPQRIDGPFGLKRECRLLVLNVDDPEGFIAALGAPDAPTGLA